MSPRPPLHVALAWGLLHRLPPSIAYRLVHSTPAWLSRLLARASHAPRPRGDYRFLGLRLPSPIGLAAGLDKDGNLTWTSWALGFGFSVVGSVLPRRHPGAPDKILVRLPDGHLVNRLGLPSQGAPRVAGRLRRRPPGMPLAVSIAGLAPGDYVEAYRILAPLADWVEVNISCPNTVEHGTFEDPEWARRILGSLARLEPRRPLLLKIPRTTDRDQLQAYADVVRETGAAGIVAANTLKTRIRGVQAGLSGPSLYESTKKMVEALRGMLPGDRVVVAVGGVDEPRKAQELLDHGADAVEILTVLLTSPRRAVEVIHHAYETR